MDCARSSSWGWPACLARTAATPSGTAFEADQFAEKVLAVGLDQGVLQVLVEAQAAVELQDGALEGRARPVVDGLRELGLVFDLGQMRRDVGIGHAPVVAGQHPDVAIAELLRQWRRT